MEERQIEFERSKLRLTCDKGVYGLAMIQYEQYLKYEGGHAADLQYSWKSAKIPYGSHTVMQCGSAIIVTSFLQYLFGGQRNSIQELAIIASEGNYQKMDESFEATRDAWFDDLEKNFSLNSERIWDCKLVSERLKGSRNMNAFVMRVRDSEFYVVNPKKETYHYVLLMGVRGEKAYVFDAGFGVKQHLSLRDLIYCSDKIWEVSKI